MLLLGSSFPLLTPLDTTQLPFMQFAADVHSTWPLCYEIKVKKPAVAFYRCWLGTQGHCINIHMIDMYVRHAVQSVSNDRVLSSYLWVWATLFFLRSTFVEPSPLTHKLNRIDRSNSVIDVTLTNITSHAVQLWHNGSRQFFLWCIRVSYDCLVTA